MGAWELLGAICYVHSLNYSLSITFMLRLCHSATWKNREYLLKDIENIFLCWLKKDI